MSQVQLSYDADPSVDMMEASMRVPLVFCEMLVDYCLFDWLIGGCFGDGHKDLGSLLKRL